MLYIYRARPFENENHIYIYIGRKLILKNLKNAENESKMKISRAKPRFSSDKRDFTRLTI